MRPENVIRGIAIDQVEEMKAIINKTLKILKADQKIKSNRLRSLNRKKNELSTAFKKTIRYIDNEIKSTELSAEERVE